MLVVFDIPDEINLPEETIGSLATGSAWFSLCTEWRWFGGAHLEHVLIAVPGTDEGDDTTTTKGED